MDPIFRRSSFFYLTTLLTYCGLMGRFLITRDWPVFEIIPLFMPVWLVSALLFSEHDESYAFLRTLPVADRVVVRIKFRLILLLAAAQWLLMTGAAVWRGSEGVSEPSTLVYITLICAFALLVVGCLQVAIWRYGISVMARAIGVSIGLGLVLVLLHTLSLKRVDGWPALSRLAVVEFLGGAPWLSDAVLIALVMAVYHRLMLVGVRIKASSEAHL